LFRPTLGDISPTTLGRANCTDRYDTPAKVIGGTSATQNSCANGNTSCSDGFCDSIAYVNGERPIRPTWFFGTADDGSTPESLYWQSNPPGGVSVVPFRVQVFGPSGLVGNSEAYRIELDHESAGSQIPAPFSLNRRITSPVHDVALLVSVTPSTAAHQYSDIILTRNENANGDTVPTMSAFRHAVTKQVGRTLVGVDMSDANIDDALAIGPNNVTTHCADVWNAAQISGPSDGIADRDGITALCTNLYNSPVGAPQTSGSPDTLCDSDGVTLVETDLNDTGSLPQSGCSPTDTTNLCPDNFCDSNGATTWDASKETFTDLDVEAVMLGAGKGLADAQHYHSQVGPGATPTTFSDNAAANETLIGTAANSATWKPLPAGGTDGCQDAGDKPIYTASTQSWGCGTDRGLTSVGDSNIADGAVDGGPGGEIADGSITTEDIATNAVGSADVGAVDAEASGVTLTIPAKIWFPVAGCQNPTANLLMDSFTTNAAAPACIAGTNTVKGVADFDGTTDESLQTTVMLPLDWAGAVDVSYKWLAAATTGSVTWCTQLICTADAETDDPAFPAQASGLCVSDATKGTTLQTNDASDTGITATGCAAGELMHVRISRDPDQTSTLTDNMAGDASLIGFELTLRRAM
jgi:hypothetical protein